MKLPGSRLAELPLVPNAAVWLSYPHVCAGRHSARQSNLHPQPADRSIIVGVKKTGKGRRKIGRKKRRMRARIRHRKK
jgi:hypothetical protein